MLAFLFILLSLARAHGDVWMHCTSEEPKWKGWTQKIKITDSAGSHNISEWNITLINHDHTQIVKEDCFIDDGTKHLCWVIRDVQDASHTDGVNFCEDMFNLNHKNTYGIDNGNDPSICGKSVVERTHDELGHPPHTHDYDTVHDFLHSRFWVFQGFQTDCYFHESNPGIPETNVCALKGGFDFRCEKKNRDEVYHNVFTTSHLDHGYHDNPSGASIYESVKGKDEILRIKHGDQWLWTVRGECQNDFVQNEGWCGVIDNLGVHGDRDIYGTDGNEWWFDSDKSKCSVSCRTHYPTPAPSASPTGHPTPFHKHEYVWTYTKEDEIDASGIIKHWWEDVECHVHWEECASPQSQDPMDLVPVDTIEGYQWRDRLCVDRETYWLGSPSHEIRHHDLVVNPSHCEGLPKLNISHLCEEECPRNWAKHCPGEWAAWGICDSCANGHRSRSYVVGATRRPTTSGPTSKPTAKPTTTSPPTPEPTAEPPRSLAHGFHGAADHVETLPENYLQFPQAEEWCYRVEDNKKNRVQYDTEECQLMPCPYVWNTTEWSLCDVDFSQCMNILPGRNLTLHGIKRRKVKCQMRAQSLAAHNNQLGHDIFDMYDEDFHSPLTNLTGALPIEWVDADGNYCNTLKPDDKMQCKFQCPQIPEHEHESGWHDIWMNLWDSISTFVADKKHFSFDDIEREENWD